MGQETWRERNLPSLKQIIIAFPAMIGVCFILNYCNGTEWPEQPSCWTDLSGNEQRAMNNFITEQLDQGIKIEVISVWLERNCRGLSP